MSPSERDLTIARDLLLAAGWDRDEFVKAIAEALVKARAEAIEEAAESVRSALTTGLLTPANVAQAVRAIRALAKGGCDGQ
jgi:hypothetical protein